MKKAFIILVLIGAIVLGVITTLRITHSLFDAIEHGDIKAVETLIEKYPRLVNTKFYFKGTPEARPLHRAVILNNREIVRVLLEKGADVNAQDIARHTPLHLAARDGQENIARLLLEYGADPDARNRDGDTSMHKAAKGGHNAIIGALLAKGADINAENGINVTPYEVAVWEKKGETTKYLKAKGAFVEVKECPQAKKQK